MSSPSNKIQPSQSALADRECSPLSAQSEKACRIRVAKQEAAKAPGDTFTLLATNDKRPATKKPRSTINNPRSTHYKTGDNTPPRLPDWIARMFRIETPAQRLARISAALREGMTRLKDYRLPINFPPRQQPPVEEPPVEEPPPDNPPPVADAGAPDDPVDPDAGVAPPPDEDAAPVDPPDDPDQGVPVEPDAAAPPPQQDAGVEEPQLAQPIIGTDQREITRENMWRIHSDIPGETFYEVGDFDGDSKVDLLVGKIRARSVFYILDARSQLRAGVNFYLERDAQIRRTVIDAPIAYGGDFSVGDVNGDDIDDAWQNGTGSYYIELGAGEIFNSYYAALADAQQQAIDNNQPIPERIPIMDIPVTRESLENNQLMAQDVRLFSRGGFRMTTFPPDKLGRLPGREGQYVAVKTSNGSVCRVIRTDNLFSQQEGQPATLRVSVDDRAFLTQFSSTGSGICDYVNQGNILTYNPDRQEDEEENSFDYILTSRGWMNYRGLTAIVLDGANLPQGIDPVNGLSPLENQEMQGLQVIKIANEEVGMGEEMKVEIKDIDEDGVADIVLTMPHVNILAEDGSMLTEAGASVVIPGVGLRLAYAEGRLVPRDQEYSLTEVMVETNGYWRTGDEPQNQVGQGAAVVEETPTGKYLFIAAQHVNGSGRLFGFHGLLQGAVASVDTANQIVEITDEGEQAGVRLGRKIKAFDFNRNGRTDTLVAEADNGDLYGFGNANFAP